MSKQNVLDGNETIQLVGMTFLISKYHIKLIFQKDQCHFILKCQLAVAFSILIFPDLLKNM